MSNPRTEFPRQIASVLAWYRDMGVTAAVGADALDWRARGDRQPGAGFSMPEPVPAGQSGQGPLPRPQDQRPGRAGGGAGGGGMMLQSTPAPPAAPSIEPPARQRPGPAAAPPRRAFEARPKGPAPAAAVRDPVTADSLAALGAALAGFEGCGLKATAKNLCLYRGAERARLMIIGEAPGREEDLAGKPFVGPAGQLLDRMLAAIEIGDGDVHITNTVYWRPPGNRTPTPQEMLACAPFLARQIELVAPKAILLLGGAAAKSLLATEEGIMKLRGKWRTLAGGGRDIPVMATLHPAYVLRAPASKRQVWRDLLAIRTAI